MTAPESPNPLHAFRDDALGNHDATALADLIRRGELSVQEVTEAAIARAQTVNPALNALVVDDFERARQRSQLPPSVGFFAGVPTLVKDNTDVTGLPTRHGSAAIRPAPASRTGLFARQYLAQGFICLGKSSLPEFGFNASTEPAHADPTRNPWHLDYSTGGSSGGSAALVAAGVVPLAHANDGGGSIRIPAACCGLVGLKPSRGRLVDGEAARSLPVNIVSEGVVTRSVRDTAHFFREAESYYRNPKLPAIGDVSHPGRKRRHIGVVFDSPAGYASDSETRAAVELTAQRLREAGHQVTEMPVPVDPRFPDDFAAYWGMLAFAVKLTGRKIMSPSFDKQITDDLTHGLDKMFRRQFYRLPGVIRRLRKTYHDYAAGMRGFDAVLTPVLGHTTPRLGHLSPAQSFDELFERLRQYVGFTPLANACGAPAIALPMSVTPQGLPVGVQVMGNHGDEVTLLELAFELEQLAPWRRIH